MALDGRLREPSLCKGVRWCNVHILEYPFPLTNSTSYKVVLACRSEAKAGLKLAMLKTERVNVQASFLQLDLARYELSIEDFSLLWVSSSLASVQRAARQFLLIHTKLDLLVLNAGTFPQVYSVTEDGFETMMQVTHTWQIIRFTPGSRWISSLISFWPPCLFQLCRKQHRPELQFFRVKVTVSVPHFFPSTPSSSLLDQSASQLRCNTTSQSSAAFSSPLSLIGDLKRLEQLPLLYIQETFCLPISTDIPGYTGLLQTSWDLGRNRWLRPLLAWWWHCLGRSSRRAQSTSTTASPRSQRRVSTMSKHKKLCGRRQLSAWSRRWAKAAALSRKDAV